MRSIDELATEICTLAGHINAANHRFLVLIAEFDRRTGWSDGATQSCAHWLNWKCGIALGAARERVRVAHALAKLPKVSAAMASGALSYSKVREITRVGNAGNERYIDMHHIKHWANGGETRPSNLVSLCRFHHRAVHEGGYDVRILDDGALRFVRPDGRALEIGATDGHQPAGDVRALPQGKFVSTWRGDQMDLGMAVDVLIQQSRKATDVPAGT